MESSTQGLHDVQQASTMVTERTVLLNSAAEAGNWSLVRKLITSGDVTASDIRQSALLENLATATGVSDHHLVVIIMNELFSNEGSDQVPKNVAQKAVISAAQCDNWGILIAILSTADTLLEDETAISLIQMITDNKTLKENSYLHIDVLSCVWRHVRQKIRDFKDKSVQSNLVQMAAKLNMWSRVCDLLDAKQNLNLLDRDGLSVLHRLVMCPDNRFDSLLSLLLKHGANANLKTLNGDTALHLAAKHQKVIKSDASLHLTGIKDCAQFKSEIVKENRTQCAEAKRQVLSTLIDSCHCVDDVDRQGSTAVIVAAENDNYEFLKLLLEHGARAEGVGQYQRSVLHVLALKGSFNDPVKCDSLVTLCVNGGAQVNSIDGHGDSALHVAVQSKNWIFFKLLIGVGADTGRLNSGGLNVLHRLVLTERLLTEDVSSLFSFLCLHDANLNALCRTGYTALHMAARGSNWSLVKHLVHLGANIHLYDIKGFTVLHIVAMITPSSNHGEQAVPYELVVAEQTDLLSVLDLLLEKGADLELRCSIGGTALHLMARHKKWFMIKYLIERGVNIHALGNQSPPLIERLIQCETETHDSLQLSCLLYGDGVTSNVRNTKGDRLLQLAARYEKWTFVDHALKHQGGNVDEPDSQGCSVLHRMATSQSKTFKEGWSCSYVRAILGKSEYLDNHQVVFLIHLAAAARNIDVVHELLDSFDDVNRTDCQGFTVLHRVARCCSSTSVAIIRRLVVKGADVDKRCPAGDTALQLAAKSGNCLAVVQLLQSGARVDPIDNEGMSILHRLIGQPQLYKLFEQSSEGENLIRLLVALLSEKSSINQKDPVGNTPLHLAIMFKWWGMAMELLTRGASLNDRDSQGYTVLNRVAQVESCPEGRMETCHLSKPSVGHLDVLDLIDDRVDIDGRDPCGNTTLMLAAAGNNWDSVDRLLKKGAAAVTHNMKGLTVLHRLATARVCSGGTKWSQSLLSNVLEDLISRGIDAKARDPEGNTPLQVAAKHGNMDMVERLLEFLENVNETDSEGFTLLSRVTQSSSPRSEDIARRLLVKGADVNMTCPDGKSPLALSVISKKWSVTSALWALTSSNNISTAFKEHHLNLHHLVEEECPSNIILRFYKNTTVMHTRLNGQSVLQLAITKRRWDLVVGFLAEGECTDFEALTGNRIFHVLAECASHTYDKKLILSLMPSDKLNINLRDDKGNTPLNILANSNKWNWIKPFVKHGADVNMPDSDGWTVLHNLAMSSYWGDLSPFVDTLVECGADIHMAGPENKTAVMLAQEKRNWSVFWQLIELGACYDWAQANKYLLLKKLCLFPKRNVKSEKLVEIINFLAHSGLNLPSGVAGVLQAQQCFENGFMSSESTSAKQQCGSDHLERLQNCFEKCVRCSNWTVANLLIESGPDNDIRRLIGGRPLIHVLVSLYKEDDHETWLSLLTALLRRGLDISSRDDVGRTVLMKHRVLLSFRELKTNPKALCIVLLEKGVNPSVVDKMGNSLLIHILKWYDINVFKIVKGFLEVGLLFCKPQIEDGIPHSLYINQLKNAISEVEPAIIKILIECGALSNSDLSALNTEYQMENMYDSESDSTDSDADVYEIIKRAASSQPRSLQHLCRLAVSRSLPYSVTRSDLVKSLSIPTVIKDYLLFSDELSDHYYATEDEECDSSFFHSDEYDTDDDIFEDDDDDDDEDDDEDDDDEDDDDEVMEEESEENRNIVVDANDNEQQENNDSNNKINDNGREEVN